MKKKFILFFLLLFSSIINVKAYENNLFKFDIPNNYNETINDNNYLFKNGNNYISITINNNNKKYNVDNYSKNDINNQTNYIKDNTDIYLKEYNVTSKVEFIKKDKINDFYTLIYDIYIPLKDKNGIDYYQKEYIFTSKNYIYTVVINSDKKIDEHIINTFQIKDETILKEYYINYIYCSLFIILFILIIVIIEKIYMTIKKQHN